MSLFCGTCSVEGKISSNKKLCNDNNKYLIAMLNDAKNGRDFPETITEEQYKYIRQHKDEDLGLSGFVGFGCSFGGKFFGGYARNSGGTNYALQSKKSLLKDMCGLMEATFTNSDYKDIPIKDNSIVYCDPPYQNTTGYTSGKNFNSNEFWEYMRRLSEKNIVFVSEQTAPEDFISIWEKEFTRTLDSNKENQPKKIEHLYVYKDSEYFSLFDK